MFGKTLTQMTLWLQH